jgi:hypothetical protein
MRTSVYFALVLSTLTALPGCCSRHRCLFGRHSACVDHDDWCPPDCESHSKRHHKCGCHAASCYPTDCGCGVSYPAYPAASDCGCGMPTDCGCGAAGMPTFGGVTYGGAVWNQPQMGVPYSSGCGACGGETYISGPAPVTLQAPPSELNTAPAPAGEYYSPKPTPAPAQTAPAPPQESASRAVQPSSLIPAGL